MIPGINLLNLALGAIQSQQVQWRRHIGTVENSMGQRVPAYDVPRAVSGSLQSIDSTKLQMMGLDLKKTYRTLFTTQLMQTAQPGTSPDQVSYGGRLYNVTTEGMADWGLQDGWYRYLLIDIGAA